MARGDEPVDPPAGPDMQADLRLGGFTYDRHSFRLGKPTPEGITFARGALHCWPRQLARPRSPPCLALRNCVKRSNRTKPGRALFLVVRLLWERGERLSRSCSWPTPRFRPHRTRASGRCPPPLSRMPHEPRAPAPQAEARPPPAAVTTTMFHRGCRPVVTDGVAGELRPVGWAAGAATSSWPWTGRWMSGLVSGEILCSHRGARRC